MDTEMNSAGGFFYPTVEALIAELNGYRQSGHVDRALVTLQSFVEACMRDRRSVAKVFADPTLDAFCQHVGRDMLAEIRREQPASAAEPVDCVFLATELYRTGGHTAVMEDLLRTERFGSRIVVVLTDASGNGDTSVAGERFGAMASCEIAPAGSLVEKLRWTLTRLVALRPRKLILMNHHNDPVAISAAQPSISEQTVFYHHGDHHLCLGVTLQHTMHIDPHPMGFDNCRRLVGVKNPIYWPLIAKDLGMRPQREFMANGHLKTCSSGAYNKFVSPYKYEYADILPRVMECTGGSHLHIGPLSDVTLRQIQVRLGKLNIPLDRFVHISWVPSVWKALHAHGIDAYLTSFPLGGGKAAIEVMGAGIPIVGHDSYISPFFGGASMFYPSAFVWADPEQLLQHLRGLSAERLARESIEARRHFEHFHTLEALSRAIDAGDQAPPAPPVRRHTPNPLQSFLDDVHYAPEDYLTAPSFERANLATRLVEQKARSDLAHAEALRRAFELETVEMARLAAEDVRH